MNYTEAYLKLNCIDTASAKDMLTSPLGKFIKSYIDTSTSLGLKSILDAYDPNVSNTLRGELRTLTAIKTIFDDILKYSEGITSDIKVEENNQSLTDEGFDHWKQPIQYK